MFSTTAAPAGYVSTTEAFTDAYGNACEREVFTPAPGTYAPAPLSAALTVLSADDVPTGDLSVLVALEGDCEGGMAHAFDLHGEARGVADATAAREVAAVAPQYVVAILERGALVSAVRGEG